MNIKMLRKIWFVPGVLMFGVILIMVYLTQPAFRMTMDVNPSIELVTNRLDRVVEVNPLNEDAEKMLQGFVVSERSLEKTLNDIVDRMILEGYIHGGDDNVVMISVNDPEADPSLVKRINETIKAYLENKRIEATLLSGSLGDIDDDSLTGKEKAVQKMADIGVGLSEAELSQMTLKELFEYSRAQNISEDEIFRIVDSYIYSDTMPKDGMLSAEDAGRIALDKVPGEIIKVELDDNEYEIKILRDGVRYELEIDAYSGTVRELEQDDDDDDFEASDQSSRLTLEEARAIALRKVNGEILEEERDDDSYDFKISLEGKKYEVEIHAFSGAVKEYKIDDSDDDDDRENKDKNKKSGRLTLEEARRVALGRVNGTILEEERDDDSYDFEIRLDGKKYEIEIDAFDGKIKEFEVEDDD